MSDVRPSFAAEQFYVGLALTINNATGPERRGEMNGVANTVDSLARIVSPIACASMYAFTNDGEHTYPFDYHFTFYVLTSVRLVAACMGWNTITGGDNSERCAQLLEEAS